MSLNSQAQSMDILRMQDGKMILKISTELTQKKLDSILKEMNMMKLSLDSLQAKQLNNSYLAEGWEIHKVGSNYIELVKNFERAQAKFHTTVQDLIFDFDKEHTQQLNTFYPEANWGYNKFKNRVSVKTMDEQGTIRFLFYNRLNAGKVILSGSFNAWAIEELNMMRTDTAWYCDVKLKPGKHLYKFIVDGEWMVDPENKQREDDTYGGYNSVYFVCNHNFRLDGYRSSKKVIVSGSFNNWDENDVALQKKNNYWILPMYFKDGTYSYKFIVDRNWMVDPLSSNNQDDGNGNVNSVFSIGEPTIFKMEMIPNAKEVFIAGDFNEWRKNEIRLSKVGNDLLGSYVIAPGNYQYKVFIDGIGYTDPKNPNYIGEGTTRNSFLCVDGNYTFTLNGYQNAKDVRISGTFLNWADPGLKMTKTETGWKVSVYLPTGKHLYKFIVDGNWMIDPANPLFEENEHNTGNSFLWIK